MRHRIPFYQSSPDGWGRSPNFIGVAYMLLIIPLMITGALLVDGVPEPFLVNLAVLFIHTMLWLTNASFGLSRQQRDVMDRYYSLSKEARKDIGLTRKAVMTMPKGELFTLDDRLSSLEYLERCSAEKAHSGAAKKYNSAVNTRIELERERLKVLSEIGE